MFISSLLLCAGESSRMGKPKALLCSGGETFVSRALVQLLNSQASEVICVTGSDYPLVEREIVAASPNPKLKIARNENFKKGILSSIQTGVRAMNPRAEAFVVTLVDLPHLITADYNYLMDSYKLNRPLLARYNYQGEAAHPAIFKRELETEILSTTPHDFGLNFLFEKYQKQVWWLETDSRRGIDDIDTREEYLAHITN